ncbi:hypothetical protein Pmar_PMAR026410 [Perkinsus marinus ATCC 50983]|uniref:Uncharacterized protein n=1 Tax=Perkinsus marinus (strain ATCC 50983 / TXsc) TaxID=423536 RepID=C5LEP0_PERM5|nr:hypothetical protein Pmar_PMAR026410 [Perkinsus marinus ATCC 50983]EER04858.1 hypothetical protein Pmar_PMAR026410 [Perkinsus marinus ATCC 50983]|eukprot:XP_002773042.1 hypothetical protein Pmar_PMAR026410 [Perkinsus marinus ATCC 50983]
MLEIRKNATELPPVHRWRSREIAMNNLVEKFTAFSETQTCATNMQIAMVAYLWYVIGIILTLSLESSSVARNFMLAVILQAVTRILVLVGSGDHPSPTPTGVLLKLPVGLYDSWSNTEEESA